MNSDSTVLKERLDLVKNKVLELMKEKDRKNRDRLGSVSSVGSVRSHDRKRQFSGGTESDRLQVRNKPNTSPLSS